MQREAAQLGQEARFAFAQPLLSDLVGLAGKVYTAYNSKKREMAALDNDDLLILAARALKESEHVREAFSDKFKLIMVDEFQDTDQLQIDMVRTMAGARGERCPAKHLPLPRRRRCGVRPPCAARARKRPEHAHRAARQLPQPCRHFELRRSRF